jgi:hypothetical protein
MLINPCRECENGPNNSNCPELPCAELENYLNAIGPAKIPTEPPTEKRIIIMPETRKEPQPKGKICSKCKTAKDVSEFSKKSNLPDGLDLYCRPCKAKLAKDQRIRRLERQGKNKPIKPAKMIVKAPITDPITDNVHMVNISPIIDKLNHHYNEARKIINFLDIIRETTGAKIEIPKFPKIKIQGIQNNG